MAKEIMYTKMKECLVHEADLKRMGFKGSIRKELSKRMNCSLQEIDRYRNANKLIYPFQQWLLSGRVGLSNLMRVSTKPHNIQHELYSIFVEIEEYSKKQGVFRNLFKRENCNTIVIKYDEGKQTAQEIWTYLTTVSSKNNPQTKAHPVMNDNNDSQSIAWESMSKKEKGDRYVNYVVVKLKECGFTEIVIGQTIKDYGADILAVKDGIKFAFQCKWRKDKRINKNVCNVILEAKKYYRCSVAVVVSNCRYGKGIREAADEDNILLWQLDYMI